MSDINEQALHALVSDWQANGNSRELGDPTDRVWFECAQQLLSVLDGKEGPTQAEVNAAVVADLPAFQANAWDEGMLAFTEGKGSDANPYRQYGGE